MRVWAQGAVFGLTASTFTGLLGQPRIFYRMAVGARRTHTHSLCVCVCVCVRLCVCADGDGVSERLKSHQECDHSSYNPGENRSRNGNRSH